MTPSKPWKSSQFSRKIVRKFANFAIYIMIYKKKLKGYCLLLLSLTTLLRFVGEYNYLIKLQTRKESESADLHQVSVAKLCYVNIILPFLTYFHVYPHAVAVYSEVFHDPCMQNLP